MAKKTAKRKIKAAVSKVGISLALAILALVLNILILPGLGSLIAGKTKDGMWQLIISIIGLIMMLLTKTYPIMLIGAAIFLVALIWGILTGARLIRVAK